MVTWLGTGKKVLARTTEEVGQRGAVFVAVIAVGGTGCMGAYFVSPVCKLYGVPQAPAAGCAPPGAALLTPFTTAGPAVPVTSRFADWTAGEKVPVMPVSVNRSEYVQIVPPAEATANMPKKLIDS